MEDRKDMQTRLVPGVGQLPYPAYRGKAPYVFVSYARLDSKQVLEEIKCFNDAGFHVWYDEGIAPGNEWSDAIAEALQNCSVFVVFLTPTSAPRENVLNEIDFALNEQKPFLAIHLEETTLPPGLKLRISRKQAILKYLMSDEEYEYKFTEAFTRFGLNRHESETPSAKKEDVAMVSQLVQEPMVSSEEIFDDSPEDAKKRAGDDLVRVAGFDVERGLLRGYFGTDKDITIPPFVRVVGANAFDRCQSFIESVDLNQVAVIFAGQSGVFSNCPNLKTVKIPARYTEVITPEMFQNCPNLMVYVHKNQVSSDFEERFTGKDIVYLDE